MATLQSVFDDTRSHVDEATARFYSDTEIVRWINEAIRDVNRRAETNLFRRDIPTQADTADIQAPEDTGRLHRLEWTPDDFSSTYVLEPHSRYEMDSVWGVRQAQTGTYPMFFATFSQPPTLKISLYPVPGTAGTLRIFYYPMPVALVLATDAAREISLAAGWEDLVPLYAEYMAKRKGADPTWQEAKALYEERLKHFIELTRSWHDQAGSWTFGNQVYPAWLVGEYG